MEQIWPFGLMLDETEFPFDETARVVVLVESPEHGRALNPLLPAWTLMTAPDASDELPESLGADLPQSKTIITLRAVDRLRVFNPHVLIVGSGGEVLADLNNYSSATPDEPSLIVDLVDRRDGQPDMASQRRFLGYHSLTSCIAGFPVDRANPLGSP